MKKIKADQKLESAALTCNLPENRPLYVLKFLQMPLTLKIGYLNSEEFSMKKHIRFLSFAILLLSISPIIQAESPSSIGDSIASFFLNDTDSPGIKAAKYGIGGLTAVGALILLYKYFFKSASNKADTCIGFAPAPYLAEGPLALSTLQNACSLFPEHTKTYSQSAVHAGEFKRVIEAYLAHMEKQLNLNSEWLNFDQKLKQEFTPYVQKLVVPNDSEIAMWGDLHGSVHSLMRTLIKLRNKGYIDDNFKIIKDNFYMFFLGDYVDRGRYGVEVIYILLRLKLANPDRVFLVRGNHEDAQINDMFGFARELNSKGLSHLKNLIFKIYETMPLALFLGKASCTDFIQCCHGGIEPGFNPDPLLNANGNLTYEWITELKSKDWLEQLPTPLKTSFDLHASQLPNQANFIPQTPTIPTSIGFMWNEFIVEKNKAQPTLMDWHPQRGWLFGQSMTHAYNQQAWLAKSPNKICRIIRAHQHRGEMLDLLIDQKGVVSLWNGAVYTLLSAPASNIPDFSYDSFVVVQAAHNWPITQHYASITESSLWSRVLSPISNCFPSFYRRFKTVQ